MEEYHLFLHVFVFLLYWKDIFGFCLYSLPQRASIGERFFTGMSYSSMLKKMKKRLGESADYYTEQASDNRDQAEGL